MDSIIAIISILVNILIFYIIFPLLKERLKIQEAHISLKEDMLKFEQNKTQFMNLVHSSNVQSYTDFNNIKVDSDIINQLKVLAT